MNTSKKFGFITFLGLVLILPVVMFALKQNTNTQQEATSNVYTCEPSGGYCSENNCVDNGTSFILDKTCPSIYHDNKLHNQFCCKRPLSSTPPTNP